MKRTVGGITYDTATSELIASGSHDDPSSQAGWTLYRSQGGAFFEVVTGHDGVLSDFIPLTDAQARVFVETNANALVETVFGPLPEARRARFSRRTVIAAIDVLERKLSQAAISSLLVDFGPEVYEGISDSGSAKSRMVELKKFLDRHPRYVVEDGILEDVLVERAAKLLPAEQPRFAWSQPAPPIEEFDRLKRVLQQDGFIVTDGALRRELPEDIGLPEAQSELVRLLNRHGLAVAKGHLEQALDNHARGNWASANAQIRTFFEGLLDDIAVKLDSAAGSKPSGHPRRTHLANLTPPFLDRALNEWDDSGLGFVNGLMKRLHPSGSHPGLSDEDDCTFRLHIVLLTARLFLSRFNARAAP